MTGTAWAAQQAITSATSRTVPGSATTAPAGASVPDQSTRHCSDRSGSVMSAPEPTAERSAATAPGSSASSRDVEG
ncbi:MAG: hypothetical protein V9E99_15725 [Microthrixaceae bacterium]